ncbi:MAG TPA: winged helix-turn-helix domain-containing protein, partial [Stackebrandtia sp.]|uniref:AfsR/SARP family transcriptional regulator n=1 Tax=Stackebrandtia sp. TaxID=2023065 RepID=UPI002D2C05F5
MRFGILGTTEVTGADGRVGSPRGPGVRALLAVLLLNAGRSVSADRLIAALYEVDSDAGSPASLQAQVSRLRRELRDSDLDVGHGPGGYRLDIDAAD